MWHMSSACHPPSTHAEEGCCVWLYPGRYRGLLCLAVPWTLSRGALRGGGRFNKRTTVGFRQGACCSLCVVGWALGLGGEKRGVVRRLRESVLGLARNKSLEVPVA